LAPLSQLSVRRQLIHFKNQYQDNSMKSTKCQSCGFVGFSATGNCKSCGVLLIQHPTPAPPQPNYGPTAQSQQGQKKGLAIFSLVLGIVCFLTLGLLGVFAIPGIIIAVVAMKQVKQQPWIYGGRGLAIAGLVLNSISLAATLLMSWFAVLAVR
jgi:Domain of unknown function (DUF4190)